MAKDIFHDTVRKALEKDGWKITHDPYRLRYGIVDVYAYYLRSQSRGYRTMDKIGNYRQIICQFLQDFAKDDREAQLIFDPERDRYLVMHVGWRNDYWRSLLFHRIRDRLKKSCFLFTIQASFQLY
jgi:hypothetical protein